MKAHIEWVERVDNNIKRKTRITFLGNKQIKCAISLTTTSNENI